MNIYVCIYNIHLYIHSVIKFQHHIFVCGTCTFFVLEITHDLMLINKLVKWLFVFRVLIYIFPHALLEKTDIKWKLVHNC